MPAIPEQLILENERVKLRLLTNADFEYLLPFALHEPAIWKYSTLEVFGEDNLKNYIAIAVKGYEDEHSFPFIIYDRKLDAYAGTTRYYDIQPDQKSLQLGYTWYGSAFQGTGMNKHCKLLLLQYAFEELCYERVEFRADARNERSIAAMKSIGCSVEGILRNHVKITGGGRRDSIVLSILKDEWTDFAKENLLLKIKNLL